MQQQIAKRFVIGLFIIAALIFMYQWLLPFFTDPGDKGRVETAGLLVALEDTDDGTQLVSFDAKGNKTVAAGDWNGKEVRQATWRSDGNRVMLIANRDADAFQIYRWNTGANSVDRRMPEGSRNVSHIWYAQNGSEDWNDRGLAVVGGLVYEFVQGGDPRLTQVLPPQGTGPTMTETEGVQGSGEALSGPYKALGDSFSEAAYAAGGQVIFAIMRRDEGEVLIAQRLGVDEENRPFPPVPIMAADSIEMYVNGSGQGVFSFWGFQWPDPNAIPEDFRKDGKITTPYRNGLALLSWNETNNQPMMVPVFLTPNDDAVRAPTLSQDGQAIVAQFGALKDGQFVGQALILMPAKEAGIQESTPIGPGTLTSPTISADGSMVASIGKDEQGRTRVYIIERGGPPVAVGDPGDYRQPIFSPQAPAKASP
jgi:hypothetical protein